MKKTREDRTLCNDSELINSNFSSNANKKSEKRKLEEYFQSKILSNCLYLTKKKHLIYDRNKQIKFFILI